MSATWNLSVQSFCFREIKGAPALARAVRACGLDRVELCGTHIDFQDPASHASVLRDLAEGGVKVTSAGVNGIDSRDERAARNHFEFLKSAGARAMSISVDMEGHEASFRLAERLAEEYGVSLGLHNHGGYCWFGSIDALAYIFRHTSPRIGLCLDTAWAMQTGSSPLEYVARFGSRIHAVHIKDFAFRRDGRWDDVVAGTGNLDLAALRDALAGAGFSGDLIIEYEGHPEAPVPAVTECAEAVRAVFA